MVTILENDRDTMRDSNGLAAKERYLNMNTEMDDTLGGLRDIGVKRVSFYYFPERHSVKGPRYDDQINIEIEALDGQTDLYTMQLTPDEPSRDGAYHVKMGNRREIQELRLQWLEISRRDANRVRKILATIEQIPNPTFATPYDI
jgi:hypothetical protein